MQAISSSQMRAWEHAADKAGIPSSVLMENAGRASAEFILKTFPEASSILIVCGKGNNAGDGFAAARHLFKKKKIEILLLVPPSDLKGDAAVNYKKCLGLDIPARKFVPEEGFQSYDLIVDAVLGTGVAREVMGNFRSAIEAMNTSNRPVVALDIPSGIHADTGEILGTGVRAAYTLTFGAAKHGLFRKDGPAFSGQVKIMEIGLPGDLLEKGKESSL